MISARQWNSYFAEPLARGRVLPGARSRVTRTRVGQTVHLGSSNKWRHPWFTTPIWQGAQQQWVAVMKPGFVNGRAPVVRQTIQQAKSDGRDYGINPLTGQPYFSAWIFDNPSQAAETTTISTPLYFSPAIRLSWRNIGWDGPGETVPGFFRNLGVSKAPTIDFSDPEAGATAMMAAPPVGNRLLRACDLVLHQPRVALTSQISIEPGLLTGMSNVTQTLSLRQASPGDALQILSLSKWDSMAAFNQGIDPLAGDYEEATWDEVLVATVYMLSAPGVAPMTQPDGTWQPYVAHKLFWNLNYGQPPFRVVNPQPELGFISPLAGGAAQLVMNVFTSTINDATSNALNVLQASSMKGSFWAATGGGSGSDFPVAAAAPAVGATGLDKDGRLQATRQAAANAVKAAKLDPVFPYNAPAFPLSLLA